MLGGPRNVPDRTSAPNTHTQKKTTVNPSNNYSKRDSLLSTLFALFCNSRRIRPAGANAAGDENRHRRGHQPHHVPEDRSVQGSNCYSTLVKLLYALKRSF